jgi:hypothetical protein
VGEVTSLLFGQKQNCWAARLAGEDGFGWRNRARRLLGEFRQKRDRAELTI